MTASREPIATLRISQSEVTFRTSERSYSHFCGGPTLAARERLRELADLLEADPSDSIALDDPLDKTGRALGMSFLDGPAGLALAQQIAEAGETGRTLRLAVEVVDDDLADLPWDALILPDHCDPTPGRRPLALDPRVMTYRVASGPTSLPGPLTLPPGPLRIVLAIGCPERAGLSLLNYERELERVLRAVDPARASAGTEVRILNWGTTEAIRASLAEKPAHVLHISCHAEPGYLSLETLTGDEDRVDANRLIREIIPAGSMVPLIVLAGCSTSKIVRPGRGPGHERSLPGLARSLIAGGVPAVIAMSAAVSDEYATRFSEQFYRMLARDPDADVLTVFTAVRRSVGTGPDVPGEPTLPSGTKQDEAPGDHVAASCEWVVPTLFLHRPVAPVLGTASRAKNGPVSPAVVRPDPDDLAYFVGRRAELRDIRQAFAAGRSSILVCGMGGIGKTALAAASVAMLAGTAGLPVRMRADQRPDEVLTAIAEAVRSAWSSRPGDLAEYEQRRLLAGLVDAGLRWQDRLAQARDEILPRHRILLVLDVSDRDLVADGASCLLADPDVAAFLSFWMGLGDRAALLGTSRRPFELPGNAHHGLHLRYLGPLSDAETHKLIFQLPALQPPPPGPSRPPFYRQLARLAGHPLALVQLNALLSNAPAVSWETAADEVIEAIMTETGLGDALTRREADDGVLRLVTGASVYRRAVSRVGMNWQLTGSLRPSADQARTERLSRALAEGEAVVEDGTPDGDLPADAGASEQVRLDLVDARRPSDDPALVQALRGGMALGVLAGPFNPADGATAGYRVLPVVATWLLRTSDPSAIGEAHRRAAAYWRWAQDALQMDPRFDPADTWRLGEALEHLFQAKDILRAEDTGSVLAVIPDRAWGLTSLGRAGAEEARALWTLAASRVPDLSRENCGFQLLAGLTSSMLGEFDRGVTELWAAVEVARDMGDAPLIVACASVLVRLLSAMGRMDRAQMAVAESAEAAARAGDEVLQATVLLMRSQAAASAGDLAAVITLSAKALALVSGVALPRLSRGYRQFDLALIAEVLGRSDAQESVRRQSEDDLLIGHLAMDVEFTGNIFIAHAAATLGKLEEAENHAHRAAEMAADSPLADYELFACYANGVVRLMKNELDAAEEQFRRARLGARYLGISHIDAFCCAGLADVAGRRGSMIGVAAWLEKAVSAANETGNGNLIGVYSAMRALFSTMLEDGEEITWIERARSSGAAENPFVTTTSTLLEAQHAYMRDDNAEADRLGREALEGAEAVGAPLLITTCLRLLAANSLECDSFDDAEWAIGELLDIAESSGDKMALAVGLLLKGQFEGEMAHTAEEWDEVEQVLQQALSAAEEIGAQQVAAMCFQLLAKISVRGEDFAELENRVQILAVKSRDVDDEDGILHAIEGHILAALGEGDFATATEQLELHCSRTNGSPAECRSLLYQGLLLTAREEKGSAEKGSAEKAWSAALAMAEEAGDRSTAGLAASALADAAEENGQLPTAQHRLIQQLIFADPTDLDERLFALRKLKDISLRRAAAEPGYPWSESLSSLAAMNVPPELRAACYQQLGEAAAEAGERDRAEQWLRQSLALAAGADDHDILIGRRATRRSLAMLLLRDGSRTDEAVALFARNIAESIRDDQPVFPTEGMMLRGLRDFMGSDAFKATILQHEDERTCEAILREI